MERFEVYRLEFTWRDGRDMRPVVVVSPQWYLNSLVREAVLVAPVSSAMDLHDTRRHFPIDANHPHFRATGLRKTSYVAVDYLTHVERSELRKLVGQLKGTLADDFKAFFLSFFS